MSRKSLIIVTTLLLAVVSIAGTQIKTEKTYGDIAVEKIISIDNGFVFRCDIKDLPAIIGKDIPVRINGIEGPQSITEKSPETAAKWKAMQLQTRAFIQTAFDNAKQPDSIVLKNIKRGEWFCIVADVEIDGSNLAQLLIENKIAKRVDEDHPASLKTVAATEKRPSDETGFKLVASKKSKVFHRPNCRFIKTISPNNIIHFNSKQQALKTGRRPCKTCKF